MTQQLIQFVFKKSYEGSFRLSSFVSFVILYLFASRVISLSADGNWTLDPQIVSLGTTLALNYALFPPLKVIYRGKFDLQNTADGDSNPDPFPMSFFSEPYSFIAAV